MRESYEFLLRSFFLKEKWPSKFTEFEYVLSTMRFQSIAKDGEIFRTVIRPHSVVISKRKLKQNLSNKIPGGHFLPRHNNVWKFVVFNEQKEKVRKKES